MEAIFPTFLQLIKRRLSSRSGEKIIWVLVAILLGVMLARLPLWVAVGLVVGTAVFLLVLIQPLLGLGLALLAGPWGALENIVLGNSLLDSGQLLLLVALAAWIARGLLHRRITLPHTFLNLPLLLFIYVAALTLLWAPSLTFGVREVLKWLEIGLIMLMVVDLANERLNAREGGDGGSVFWVLAMLLLAGLSQALVGIWQFGLRGSGPDHFSILGRFYRAYGTFEQPNPFGGFMNLTALLAAGAFLGLAMAFWGRWKSGEKGRAWPFLFWLFFAGGTAVATILALVFSWSRGAWLGFAAGVVAFLFFWFRKRWVGALVLVLAAALFLVGMQVGLVPSFLSDRLTGFQEDLSFGDVRGEDINDANYAVLERLAHWQTAVDMAREHLWLGVGFGNYEPAYATYAILNWPDALGHAHNYYLNVLAETGVVGLVAYLLFWTAVFWQTMRLLPLLAWPHRGIALGLLASWAALSSHHLVDKLYVNNIYIHLGVMLGLLQLLEKQAFRCRTEVKE